MVCMRLMQGSLLPAMHCSRAKRSSLLSMIGINVSALSPHINRALWEACRLRAMDVGGGCSAELVRNNVSSLAQLEADAGPFDAVVVAAGAAVGAVSELRAHPFYSRTQQRMIQDVAAIVVGGAAVSPLPELRAPPLVA